MKLIIQKLNLNYYNSQCK